MRKALICLSLILFPIIACYGQIESARFEKAVIDTVEAMHVLSSTIDLYNSRIEKKIKDLKPTPQNKAKIEEYKSFLLPLPEKYSEIEWRKVLHDSDKPSKKTIIEREAHGLDRYKFKDLLAFLYTDEEELKKFEKYLSVVGLFDGNLEDRIGIFPGNNLSHAINPTKEEYEFFDNILIKSMWETTPPHVIPLGFKTRGEQIRAIKCNAHWDDTGIMQDGLEIRVLKPESTDGIKIFLHFNGNEWKSTLPENVECMSYDECYDSIKARGFAPTILKGRYLDQSYNSIYARESDISFSFLAASDENLEGKAFFRNPILKYKINKDGKEVTGNCYLEEKYYLDIFVERNYKDSGNDVIVAEYIEDKYGMRNRRRSVYKPAIDPNGAMRGPIIRDKEFDHSHYLVKIADGTFCYSGDKWLMDDDD